MKNLLGHSAWYLYEKNSKNLSNIVPPLHLLPLLFLLAMVQDGDLLGGGVPGDWRRLGLLGGQKHLPLMLDMVLSPCWSERPGTCLAGLLAVLLLGDGVGDLEYEWRRFLSFPLPAVRRLLSEGLGDLLADGAEQDGLLDGVLLLTLFLECSVYWDPVG